MQPTIHFVTSLVLGMILYPFVGLYSLWVFVGGFLIDFDHYVYSIFRFRSWSLQLAYDFHNDRHLTEYERDILHLFHTLEFWVFMVVAAFVCYFLDWTFLFWMFALTFAGMVLHLFLDFFSLIKGGRVDARAISLVGWLRRRNLL